MRVVDAEGKVIGLMTSRQALNMAREKSLDLILVSESANPPVCKIADYGKLKYLESKRKRENRKHIQETKELKFGPNIADHDLRTIANKSENLLKEGDKIKFTCKFSTRELQHPKIGEEKFNKLVEWLKDQAQVETPIKLEGKFMTMVIMPKHTS